MGRYYAVSWPTNQAETKGHHARRFPLTNVTVIVPLRQLSLSKTNTTKEHLDAGHDTWPPCKRAPNRAMTRSIKRCSPGPARKAAVPDKTEMPQAHHDKLNNLSQSSSLVPKTTCGPSHVQQRAVKSQSSREKQTTSTEPNTLVQIWTTRRPWS